MILFYFFFFFQAEDGIRDFHVTGVQTCALPILPSPSKRMLRPSGDQSGRRAPNGGLAITFRPLPSGLITWSLTIAVAGQGALVGHPETGLDTRAAKTISLPSGDQLG